MAKFTAFRIVSAINWGQGVQRVVCVLPARIVRYTSRMSDRIAIHASTLRPFEAPGPEATPDRSDTQVLASANPAPVKKSRRPRPTFDDGALTRTFKFPSKAYPRSSYYVTSTEIIIRIKKARKKWKLIVPKKRVASYRTNRWFAKPRWIALELTYTQAVKLGLTEARARTPDAAAETTASNAGSTSQSESACADTTPVAPSLGSLEAPGRSNLAEDHSGPSDQNDVLDDQDSADDFQLAADQDQDEYEVEAALPQPSSASLMTRTTQDATAALSSDADPRVVPFVAQEQQPAAAPRRTFRRAITTLAAAIAGFAIWAGLDTSSLIPGPDCMHAEPAAHCANPIVTGAIGPGATPQLPASAPVDDLPLSAAKIAAIAQAELAAQTITPSVPDEKSDTAGLASTSRDAGAVVLVGRDIALPTPPPVFASAVLTPSPTVPAACGGLGVTGRNILINFDYARSRLDPAAFAVLEDFAARLRACPTSKVTIEGHTDSDGAADRNRSLSLRRAQAVRKHLVAAGADPHQLAAIGYGQARPVRPNVSQQNKRSNRRVALVVATQR
jgi:outer membrane protein OmpA-like peptidoglycan-associated protein